MRRRLFRAGVPLGVACILIAAALSASTTAAARSRDASTHPEPARSPLGRTAPSLVVSEWLHSRPRRMRSYRGRILVIEFWSIDSVESAPTLDALQRLGETNRHRELSVLGIHQAGVPRKRVADFAADHRIEIPLALDTPARGGNEGETFRRYAVLGLPAFAVIDRDGRVLYLGNRFWEARVAVDHEFELESVSGPP